MQNFQTVHLKECKAIGYVLVCLPRFCYLLFTVKKGGDFKVMFEFDLSQVI